jgi:threonine aldolase
MVLTQIAATIRKTPEDIHSPTTRLICLENADSDGRVLDLSYLEAVHSLAAQHQIAVHLDGARLFNAAVSLGVPAAAMAREADTVMFCLSKGLCAPGGSVLTGPAPVIARGRRGARFGGGMRQPVSGGCRLIALDSMTGGWPKTTLMPGSWPVVWQVWATAGLPLSGRRRSTWSFSAEPLSPHRSRTGQRSL